MIRCSPSAKSQNRIPQPPLFVHERKTICDAVKEQNNALDKRAIAWLAHIGERCSGCFRKKTHFRCSKPAILPSAILSHREPHTSVQTMLQRREADCWFTPFFQSSSRALDGPGTTERLFDVFTVKRHTTIFKNEHSFFLFQDKLC